jgi:alkaline phosphatase
MNEKDYQKVDSVVRIAHQYGKPFRFWATPDTQAAWELFRKLGIDYINTDQPAQASTYFNKVPQ